MAPIKCQVCPNYYDLGRGYQCQSCGCELRYNEKLRKQVYKVLENLGKEEL